MSEALFYHTAETLLEAYSAKRLSPVEAVSAVLARIDAVNPALNAFCFRDDETALRLAAESEARWARGDPAGPLDGVPTPVKDIFHTKGWPTLMGSKVVDPAGPWEVDDPAVARMREAGAVLIGKTTLPEFASSGVTNSPLTGITVTPWDASRNAGGSSGGTAAAIAAGMGPLGIGNDAAGSIRTPACFCGIVGFKPTFGRVPIYPGTDLGQLTATGPMARTVRDAALLMTVIAGADARDPMALPPDGRDYLDGIEDGVEGLRIALSLDLGYSPYLDPEIAIAVRQAGESFAALGARVEEAYPEMPNPLPSYETLWLTAAASLLRDLTPEQIERLGPELRGMQDAAERFSALDYMDMMTVRNQVEASLRRFLTDYDLLLTPTDVVPPFAAALKAPPFWKDEWTFMWEPLTFVFNYSRQPALSVPCGFSTDGLPIGLQIAGGAGADGLVLRAARAFERANPHHERHPPI
jgi:aspartyl-tRNA(Asn)/glutamyl-tRNA(Gln) amidotransferase subunit A